MVDHPGAEELRRPFPAEQIGKLNKVWTDDNGQKHSLILDYVGHAAVTDRLLQVDPLWNWEPLSMTEDGLPRLDEYHGLWIKLTVCGVTRLGYGESNRQRVTGETIKILIGDAIRNGAMRFGVALDLWSKGDLSGSDDSDGQVARVELPQVGDIPEDYRDWYTEWANDVRSAPDRATLTILIEAAKEQEPFWVTIDRASPIARQIQDAVRQRFAELPEGAE